MELIRQSQHKTTKWSGGKTSEIFIFPNESNFKEGNFQLRISTATIEVEESIFTKLPRVERILTVLNGKLKLIHEGHHEVELHSFDQDAFSGNWNTKCIGKAVDFNVMVKNNTKADVQIIRIQHSEERNIEQIGDFSFIYVATGSVSTDDIPLVKGDSLIVDNDQLLSAIEHETILLVVNVFL